MLRISSASLEIDYDSKKPTLQRAALQVEKTDDKLSYIVCNLSSEGNASQPVDLFFVADEEAKFKCVGNANLHITGYFTFLDPASTRLPG
jgi:hypothetical protein